MSNTSKALKRWVVGVGVVAVVVSVAALATSGSAGLVWRGDYETGNFDQWDGGVQAKADGRATIVTSPVRQGKYAARYEVRPGDNNVAGSGNGERTEALVLRRTRGREGDEQWFAWSTMFAPGFSANKSDWNIFTQWHNSGTTGGRVEFYVNGNTLGFTTHGGDINKPTAHSCNIGNKANGKWHDFVFHVKWSSSPRGFAEVWLDGRKVVQLAGIPTLYIGQDVYLKQGYYRDGQSNVSVIYDDGMRQGTSYADVAAEFPGASSGQAPKARGVGSCLPTAPTSLRAPLIVGVVKPGRVLKALQGEWSAAPSRLRYQWQASSDGSAWRNLPGATRRSLRLPATFSAARVRVRVTALNAAGSGTVVSAALAKGQVAKSPVAESPVAESPAPRPVGSPAIRQSIHAGQTLRGTVVWKATPASPVKQIDFAMDGNKVNHIDTTAPYEYTLDTTKLADGQHTLGLTVTLRDGTIVWRPYQIGTVTIDNRKR